MRFLVIVLLAMCAYADELDVSASNARRTIEIMVFNDALANVLVTDIRVRPDTIVLYSSFLDTAIGHIPKNGTAFIRFPKTNQFSWCIVNNYLVDGKCSRNFDTASALETNYNQGNKHGKEISVVKYDTIRMRTYENGVLNGIGYNKSQQLTFVNGLLIDSDVAKVIIAESIMSYMGSCPCPYNTDSRGYACGGRSAYSRNGGYSPKCYEHDVSKQEIDEWNVKETKDPFSIIY